MPSLLIDVQAKFASFQDGLDSIKRDTARTAREMERSFAGVKAVLGSVVSAFAAAFSAREIVQATIEMERMSARLDAALQATGHSAGITRQEIEQMTESLKASTPFDDDEIRNGIASLLRFREVQGDVFRDAVKLAPDLAAAINSDLVGAYQKLGRALQDPVTGMKGLREAGVKLSESQVELAKKLQEAGRFAEAQRIVIDELTKSVGGAGAAENSGLYGATKQAGKAYDDLLKAIGSTGAVQSATKSFFGFLTDSLTDVKNIIESGDWVQKLKGIALFAAGFRGFDVGGRPAAQGPTQDEIGRANIGAAAAESARMEEALQSKVDEQIKKILEKRKKAGEKELQERKQWNDRLQKEGTAGWVAYADTVLKEYEDMQAELRDIDEKRLKEIQDWNERLQKEGTASLIQMAEESVRASEEEARQLAKINEEANKTSDAVRDLGLTFTSAFEDAVDGGKKLSDVLSGLAKDVAKIFLRKNVTEPLFDAASSMFKDFNFGSIFGRSTVGSFATGTDYVPRTGLAMVHQGERIIPAGKRDSSNMYFNFNFEGTSSPDQQNFLASVIPVIKGVVRGELQHELRPGGALA